MDRNKRRGGAERLKSSLFQKSELHQGQSIGTEAPVLSVQIAGITRKFTEVLQYWEYKAQDPIEIPFLWV